MKFLLKKLFCSAALGTIIVGIIFAIGCVWYYGNIIPPERMPKVLASSISPDEKWICEIVDVHPNPYVTQALVHAGPYKGYSTMTRGFKGESYVSDFDSNGVPSDLEFVWDGGTVRVQNLRKIPIVFECTEVTDSSGRTVFQTEVSIDQEKR